MAKLPSRLPQRRRWLKLTASVFGHDIKRGRSLFLIDSVKAGLAIFEKLANDNTDSVFQSDILLRIAEGNYLSGNEREAILQYDDVTTRYPQWAQAAEAYYCMGTIVQNDWSDLVLAKSMYDQAAKTAFPGKWGPLALTKSADITKSGEVPRRAL